MKITHKAFACSYRTKTPKRELKSTRRKNQSGFSLIEVLVAALILSGAILGVASLQIIGMKGTQQSFMKSQAMDTVNEVIERMRANQAGVVAGNYVFNSTTFNCSGSGLPNCSTANCTPAQIAMNDNNNLVCGYKTSSGPRTGGIKRVSASDNVTLINGSLSVACVNCAQGDVSITVGWDERAFDKKAETKPNSVTITTRIGAP